MLLEKCIRFPVLVRMLLESEFKNICECIEVLRIDYQYNLLLCKSFSLIFSLQDVFSIKQGQILPVRRQQSLLVKCLILQETGA